MPLLSDYEQTISEGSDAGITKEEHEYRVLRARYRTRQRHLAREAEERTKVMMEMLHVLGDTELGEMINELAAKEARVTREGAVFLQSMHPDPLEPPPHPNRDILFAPADPAAADQFADEYEAVVERISKRLAPRLRMK